MKQIMNIDQDVFADSIIVDLDGCNNDGQVTHTFGYVRIENYEEGNCFSVTVFNKDGDVMSETVIDCK